MTVTGQGTTLIITVDCGVTVHEPLIEAGRIDLDVIVIYHHRAEMALPRAPQFGPATQDLVTISVVGTVLSWVLGLSPP
jgi:single-stranded-DNA-specific exonuclease